MFAERALETGRRCSTLVGPDAAVRAIWRTIDGAWGHAREVRWQQPHLEICSDPLVEPDPLVRHDHARGPRSALPGLRGDVHRGGRGLARAHRRGGALPGADPAADRPAVVLRAVRRLRRGGLQGGGGVRVAARRPGAGRLRAAAPAGPGAGHRRHGRGGGARASRHRARRHALRQRLERRRPARPTSGPASPRRHGSTTSCSRAPLWWSAARSDREGRGVATGPGSVAFSHAYAAGTSPTDALRRPLTCSEDGCRSDSRERWDRARGGAVVGPVSVARRPRATQTRLGPIPSASRSMVVIRVPSGEKESTRSWHDLHVAARGRLSRPTTVHPPSYGSPVSGREPVGGDRPRRHRCAPRSCSARRCAGPATRCRRRR